MGPFDLNFYALAIFSGWVGVGLGGVGVLHIASLLSVQCMFRPIQKIVSLLNTLVYWIHVSYTGI